MITGLRYDAFHSIPEKRNDKDFLKNIDIIYAFLFSLIIVFFFADVFRKIVL